MLDLENYGRKLMHGVMKAKRINVRESKIGTILGEISPEGQIDRTLPAARQMHRSTMLNTFVTRFITILMRNWKGFV